MTDPTCALCRTPTADAAVCWSCVEGDAKGEDSHGRPALMTNLADVPALSWALVVSYTRHGRTGDRVGSRSTVLALPYDSRAAAAAHQLRNELATDVRLLDLGDTPTAATSPALAIWLLHRLERVRHHADAAGIVVGIDRAVRRGWDVVDLPPERWYAGPCWDSDDYGICRAELYAEPGAEKITCPGCGKIHDVEARRRWLIAEAYDTLANAATLGHALPTLGEPVTAERIRQWAARGRLVHHGHDKRGHPLYRVGDVHELAVQAAQVTTRTAVRA